MKLLLFSMVIGILTSCSSQQKATAIKNKRGDLVGIANKESFNQPPYNLWFANNFDNYTVDETTLRKLKKKLKGIKIKGFMGTWCGDSKRETPPFYKVLETADFNFKNLELITVNRAKKTPDNLQENFNIIRVPTFIFYKKGQEIGRYVEYARESLEKDILKIVSEQDYKHAYSKD